MEFFPDGGHVRLRSREDGRYLYADEDGLSVSTTEERAWVNTAWAVDWVHVDGEEYLLFRSAAYGRYLGFSPDHGGAVQGFYYNVEGQGDIVWWADRAWEYGVDIVIINYVYGPLFGAGGEVMVWNVEATPARGLPPVLPPPTPHPGLFQRMITWIPGDQYGNLDYQQAGTMVFEGLSVFHLREKLAHPDRLDVLDPITITMCIWSGTHGQLTPLFTDLPSNTNPLEVACFRSWEVIWPLVYPDVDAW